MTTTSDITQLNFALANVNRQIANYNSAYNELNESLSFVRSQLAALRQESLDIQSQLWAAQDRITRLSKASKKPSTKYPSVDDLLSHLQNLPPEEQEKLISTLLK